MGPAKRYVENFFSLGWGSGPFPDILRIDVLLLSRSIIFNLYNINNFDYRGNAENIQHGAEC